MRIFIGLIGCVLYFNSMAQESALESDSILLSVAIDELEGTDQKVQFFYQPEWVDHLKIPKENLNTSLPLGEAVSQLLDNTRLNFFLKGHHVILLYNQEIIIPQVLEEQPSSSGEVMDDYQQQLVMQSNSSNGNPENKLYTIGNIKKFEKVGQSTINGRVVTEGKPAEGVYIFNAYPFVSAISDQDGYFSLTLPNGINELHFQSVTTINTYRKINLYSDGQLEVQLEVDVVALEEVTINAQRERNINSTQMGLISINPQQLSILPAFLGEKDIIKVATSTAGVQNVGEGSAGINIRGGKADQNLFLIDHHTVFTTNHFFGFFSAFNSRGIGGLSLYKNGIPAEFGGKLSSVFEIQTKKPNNEELEITGALGLVTSQLQIEGPVKKAKTSLLVNGRATYSQYILDKFKNSSIGNNEVSFYDFTFKSHTELSDKDEFSVTAYYSYDAFKMQSDTLLSFSDFSYDNKVIGASWKHTFNDQLFGVIETGNSYFSYISSYNVLPTQAFAVDLFVNEFRTAAKFDYYVNERLNYKFGVETKYYTLDPGTKSPLGERSLISEQSIDEEKALEFAPYMSAAYEVNEQLAVDVGVRYSIFNAFGPATVYEYQPGEPKQSSTIIGTQNYESGEIIHSNHGPEFRVQGRYLVGQSSSIKLGYGRTRQNTHLLLNAASIAPTDVWRLSGPFIKPQLADQVSVGYFKNFFGKHLIEASVETYYKDIQNLLDFKTGAELQFNPSIESDLLQGDGRSYGVEFSLSKSTGWLSGWLNYTYSRSFVRLDGESPAEIINGGAFFPTGYDKPHYFNSVTNYKFTRRFTLTLNMVYSSGIPITQPVGKWDFKGTKNIYYSKRNEYRIPDYFRIDLGLNINMSHKLEKLSYSSWTFSVYNVLGRDNVYSIFFEVENNEVKGYQLSIFPTPIPTITYNFKF